MGIGNCERDGSVSASGLTLVTAKRFLLSSGASGVLPPLEVCCKHRAL